MSVTEESAGGVLALTTLRRVALIGLATLLGCAGGTSPSTGRRSPAPACQTAQLHGSFGTLDAGAGQRYVPLVLTNIARNPCSLSGYPSVQLVGVGGQPIPTDVVRIDTGSVTRVTVSPGHRVSSVLHWIGIPLSDEAQTGPCEATPSHADITPPGDATPLSIAWSFDAVCGHGQIDTRPLRS